MKKRSTAAGLALLLSILLVLTACGGGGGNANQPAPGGESAAGNESAPEADGKVYELNFNVATSPTHPYVTELTQPWADYVNEKTGGRVKVYLFPNVALGPHNKTYDDMSGGVYDLGIIVAGLMPDTPMFPMSIADLPFGINDPYVATEVMTKFQDKYMKDVFGKGVTFLSTSATDAYQLLSKEPIEKLDDVKNLKINSNLQGVIDVIKRWGAAPVTMPNTDIYEALERGIIDGAVYTGSGVSSFKFYEVAHYMTIMNFAGASQTLAISTAAFEKLPPDIQQMFIEDFGPRYAEMLADMYTRLAESSAATFEENVKDKGGRVIQLSDEETAKFQDAGKPYWDSWVEEANKRGYPGDEMMADFRAWLKEAGVEINF